MQVNLNTNDINIGIQAAQNKEEAGKASTHQTSGSYAAISVTFSGARLADDPLGMSEDMDSKAIPKLRDQAMTMDADLMQDQMLVVSHGMSEADAEEMDSEGYDPMDMDPKTASTILDKIKAELAKGGTKIVGYNDDIDMDRLAEILGSVGAAAMAAEELARADIPITEDNLRVVAKALDYGEALKQPTEGEYRYMLDNQLSVDLMSFYLAENSGADRRGADLRSIPEEIEAKIPEVLERDGQEVTEENIATAEWLYRAGLPVTGEQVELAKDIKSVEFPLQQEELVQTAVNSIINNTDVGRSSLTESKTIYEKAAELLELYSGDRSGIEDARLLAEIRLRMTAEVNVRMLRNNFSIDTAPIEEMLEALKIAEEQVARDLFGEIGEQDPVEAYRLFNDSCKVINELPELPEDALGVAAVRGEGTTLRDLHQTGVELRARYEAAEISYEKMWTAPRSDLGDRITTAFRNIENMLNEMNLEGSEDNTRAVKILGRNSMEITPENIDKIKAAVQEVENVLGRMTPGSVLKMIRDGVNPLETSLKDLDKYLAEKSAEYDESARDYAEFLYRMERNGQISPEEREGYIGVFRLIHQIEKGDGAAIGALVETGAELSMSNLLTAARSNRFRGMDVKVTDGSEIKVSAYVEGESITDQITTAFRGTELKTFIEAGLMSEQQLSENTGDVFGNILEALGREALTKDDIREDSRKRDAEGRDLTTVVEDYLSQLTEEIEKATFTADSGIDVRAMQLMHKQLALASSGVKDEEYYFPMELDGQVAGIRLKLVDGNGEGLINISVDLGDDRIEARLNVRGDLVEGRVSSATGAKVNYLEKAVDIFSNELSKGVVEGREMQVNVQVDQGGLAENMNRATDGVQDRAVLLSVASQFLQSL